MMRFHCLSCVPLATKTGRLKYDPASTQPQLRCLFRSIWQVRHMYKCRYVLLCLHFVLQERATIAHRCLFAGRCSQFFQLRQRGFTVGFSAGTVLPRKYQPSDHFRWTCQDMIPWKFSLKNLTGSHPFHLGLLHRSQLIRCFASDRPFSYQFPFYGFALLQIGSGSLSCRHPLFWKVAVPLKISPIVTPRTLPYPCSPLHLYGV